MASTSATPYGFKPVRLTSGHPFNSENGLYPIASNYGTAIYNGQPVRLVAGKVQAVSAVDLGTTATPDKYIGIFMGCSYTDPNTNQKVFKQNYPASTVASDIVAYVADQVGLVLQVQCSTTAVDVVSLVGQCFNISAVGSGSATTGNSTISLVASSGANTKPFKIIGLSTDPTNINAGTGLYLDALVIVNPLFHTLAGNNG